MKKLICACLMLFTATLVDAKKVKLTVNMSGQIINVNGVHVTGDFQVAAGYGGADWDPAVVSMTQEVSDTNLYSVILELPAFAKYEYKFVNGIFGYEQEFVPVESRVNYNFIDNRWFYLDSTANDTTEIGALRFGGNAPAGKYLMRFYVDMSNESISANGVHVAGEFNNWNTNAARMYSFDGNVYEYIAYIDSTLTTPQSYLFYNGNTSGNVETVLGTCVNGNSERVYTLSSDTQLSTVCYSSCDACLSGIDDEAAYLLLLKPNPTEGVSELIIGNGDFESLTVTDLNGRMVFSCSTGGANKMILDATSFESGIYFIHVYPSNGKSICLKWVKS